MKNIRVMVVDDEPEILETIKVAFESFGYTVITALSGNEAWDLLQKEDVDLVLSDIRMPNGTGPDLLDKIKNRDFYHPRVIFITGYADLPLDSIFGLGADGLFKKPFDLTQILETIERSVMPNEKKWSIEREETPSHEISLQFESLLDAMDEGSFRIGRGGFYIRDDNPPESGEITFKFSSEDKVPCEVVSGIGEVAWCRKFERDGLAAGFGIRTLFLDESCRQPYIEWLAKIKTKHFIPNK